MPNRRVSITIIYLHLDQPESHKICAIRSPRLVEEPWDFGVATTVDAP